MDFRVRHSGTLAGTRQVKAVISQLRAARNLARRQPPEKCPPNARANEPNPPRVTPESDEVPDDEWLDEESPPKKLLRDHDPPDEP
jgi:hypothetical protein